MNPHGGEVTTEQKIVDDFFGPDPMTSPLMKRHMQFHMADENKLQLSGYGERFLLFHRKFLQEFEYFRAHRHAPPLQAWDPATEIPDALQHDPRASSYPFQVDPVCATPTWLTPAGGTLEDPLQSRTSLTQFASLDELGRSIEFDWHGRVHRTVGGDMSTMQMAPMDPVFWCWHKWIDDIVVTWEKR